MGFIGAIVLFAGVWVAASVLWERLPKTQGEKLRRWLGFWAVKGLAAPFLVWLIFNLGVSERFPPLMVRIQAAAPGWDTVAAFGNVAGIGLFMIESYWTAVTLGWLWWEMAQQVENRREFRNTALGLSILLGPLAALLVWGFGWSAAGIAGGLWLLPLVYQTIPMAFAPKRAPTYARAIAKMHVDKYREAEAAVIEELEKTEDDFKGWLMLAELYANHFDDLAGAERILRDTCAQPATTASEVCVALQRLADWHLQLANDPAAARKALEEICRRYPETHMGRMAWLRIGQLPKSREELIEGRIPRRIPLPALGRNLDPVAAARPPQAEREQSAARANECVRKLQQNPDNAAAREELARVLADRLGKVSSAIEQIELLLGMPEVSAEKAAEWMGLIGAWQIKYLDDVTAGRETLERLIRSHPQSSQAVAARGRLNLMDLENKLRAARAGAKPAAKGVPTLSLSI
jgi:hypothetical protein